MRSSIKPSKINIGMMPNKPYSESCEQNKQPILEVLGRYAHGRKSRA